MVAMALCLILLLTILPHVILHIVNLVQFWLWPKGWMEQLNLLQGVLKPLPPRLLHLHLHLGVPQVQNHPSYAQIVNGMDMGIQPQCCSLPLFLSFHSSSVKSKKRSRAFHPSSPLSL